MFSSFFSSQNSKKKNEKFPKNFSEIFFENFSKKAFEDFLEKFLGLYSKIQPLYLINLNEALKRRTFGVLKESKIIRDVKKVTESFNHDVNVILKEGIFDEKKAELGEGNSFVEFVREFEELEKSKLIVNLNDSNDSNFDGHFKKNVLSSKIFHMKKDYEIKQLTSFIKSNLKENENVFVEVGCGKSYMTEILWNWKVEKGEDFLYFGIDKQKHLIKNCKDKFGKLEKKKILKDMSEEEKSKMSKLNCDLENDKNICENKQENVNYGEIFDFLCNENNDKETKNESQNEDNNQIISNQQNISKKSKNVFKTFDLSAYSKLFFFDYFLTSSTFPEFYEKNIKPKIKSNQKITLIGLHSCGNLTPDTLKLFVNFECFSSVAVVGCCFGLLDEYINEETKNSELFKEYVGKNSINKKGEFIDDSLKYELTENIGFPMSNFIKSKFPTFFLSKHARSSATMNHTENHMRNSPIWKKNLYRSLAQSFLEENYGVLGDVFGYGRFKKFDANQTFSEFILNLLDNLTLYLENDELLKKAKNIDRSEISLKAQAFFDKNKDKENELWALNLILIKFSKIIEYIIALDRVIFLLEKGIKNVKLIKIFNNHISPRNLLIYASK